jgi:membrane-associated protease RseP (regulator of RpoE activity)
VIEIDYISKTLNFYEPNSYKYSGSGDIIPLEMLEDDSGGKVPLVRAKIMQRGRTPVEGKFIADTAVRSAISFNTPFVETNKLLGVIQKTISAPLGGGAMVRESKQPVGRVPKVQLGRYAFKNTVAIFFQNKQGITASPEFDGVIGGEILRRFNVTLDYSRLRMILEPNNSLHEPYEYDMSGLLLIAEGTDFKTIKVQQIIEDSPAIAAGLRAGDTMAAIDGKSVSNLTLQQVRQMFRQKGRTYRLSIERGGQLIQTKIKLRKLI